MEKQVYEKEKKLRICFDVGILWQTVPYLLVLKSKPIQWRVQNSVYSEGCNAQKPIGMEEKFAVFLR
jgi:hypothetical protein